MTIDGADEIDPAGNMIKGGGGALLREKIVASASDELVIIADNTKLVPQLGRFPLPVEVISFGYKKLQEKIISSGLCRKCTLRQKDGRLFITDHQNYILDLECDAISDVVALNSKLHNMPGVVETGLFINMATRTIIGFADERIEDVAIKAKV
jgi:ribose 5-phosphate isomerase A